MSAEEKIFMILAVLEKICPRLCFLPVDEIKKRVSDDWLDFYVKYFYGAEMPENK